MFATSFEKENQSFEQRKKIYSAVSTLLVHGLLMLLLYLTSLTLPNPPYQDNEGGMSVNFGTSAVGTGEEQAFTYTPIASSPPPVAKTSATSAAVEEDVATQDIEEALTMPKAETPKKITSKPTMETPAKPEKPSPSSTPSPAVPKADENALFKPGAFGKPNNSTGDGLGDGKGDQGELSGDPNATNYSGSGTGWGDGTGDGTGDGNVRLAGRKLRYKPEVTDRSQAKGKVVILIKVDRSGKVVDARYTPAGSTTSDEGLIKISIEAAYRYRFDENPSAAEIQTGAISFIYKVN
jgi:outer membrane biosynthesis protein TonB